MWQKTVAAALVLCGAQGFGYALCQEMKCMLYHDTEQKQMLLYMTREIAFLHTNTGDTGTDRREAAGAIPESYAGGCMSDEEGRWKKLTYIME